MAETKKIAEQLRKAYGGNAWHGPSLREVLTDVTSVMAARRPVRGAHTIWEIVLHIAQWENVVRRRLAGARIVTLPPEKDWPRPRDTSPAVWRKTLFQLKLGNRELRQAMARFPDRRLKERVPGKKHDFYTMLHGVVQHDLYHAGQIILLRKAP
jgi:uncharacterized damage-inducible protein DinB